MAISIIPDSVTGSFGNWSPMQRRIAVIAGGVVAFVIACVIANAVLPNGLPIGVVAQGLVIGSLNGLTAMGLVLIYRSIRVVNFAQTALGGLAAALSLLLVIGAHWSYWVAVPLGIALAVFTGFLVDLLINWRFSRSPRLIVTVVTIGIAEILGFLTLEMPHLFNNNLSPFSNFKTPFSFTFHLNPYIVTGDWLVALIVVPVCLVGLYWFFIRTDTGVAIRGAADSQDRAQLLGIPVRRLTRITWMVAAGLSGIGAILAQPIQGSTSALSTFTIAEAMLIPLAAFVLAGMESLPGAWVWSMVIGVISWAITWNGWPAAYNEVVLFVLIVVGLLLKRRGDVRVTGETGTYVAVREVAPLPNSVSRLPEIRITRAAILGIVVVLVALVPVFGSQSQVNDGIYILLYSVLAISMVILTGWGGQISLGQFALVGVGAAVTGALMVHSGLPFLVCMLLAGVVGAAVAVLLGLPALRLEGLALAVVTLAFAVAAGDWLFSSQFFPGLNPSLVKPPLLLDRFDLGSLNTLYVVCLLLALVSIAAAHNLRKSRTGRAVVSVRDNSRAASAYGISPLRSKLLAFGISGCIAALAGALYVVQQGGIPSNSFVPDLSIDVFIMVVIGGLGSITGGILGAVYLEFISTTLSSNLQLLATGAGVLLVLLIVPEGFGSVLFRVRDALAAQVAARRGLARTGEPLSGQGSLAPVGVGFAGDPGNPLAHTAALRLEALESLETEGSDVTHADAGPPAGRPAVVAVSEIDAGYGRNQVLFDVGMGVAQREIVALLGTNGAGKTTVLRTLSGLMRPTQGTVGYLGRDITAMSPVNRVRYGLVTVLGGRSIFPSLTVEENLRLASWTARRYHRDAVFARAATERVFALFPVLRTRQHQRAGLLSGGEQQMLALGQALLCRPKLLLIDELSLGLAPTVVADLLEVIRALAASGVTVMVVEQSVNIATAISNRAIFMERGRVRFSGPTPDLSRQPQLLRSVFLRAAERARARKPGPAGAAGAPTAADDVFAALAGTAPATSSPAAPGTALATAGADEVATGAMPAFSVTAVTKAYGGVAALSDVSLYVAQGEILGIIGSNGAGKTTLFDVCSGFVKPDYGRVMLYGEDVTDLSPTQRSLRGLGRVFQDARVWPTMTVHEAITTALEQFAEVRDPLAAAIGLNAVVRSEEKLAVRVEELLHEMGLERFRDHFVSDLSTGTRRIVELACAVASEPKVLLLDEPTSGIAQRESEALGELLVGLREQTGAAFIVIEHDVPLVSSISDRMVCMHLGEVIAQGDTVDVLTNPGVVAAYLGADAAAAARSGPAPVRSGAPGSPQMVAG